MIELFKDYVMKKIILTLLTIPLISFAGLNIPKVNKTLSGLKSHKPLTYFNASDQIKLSGKFKTAAEHKADIILHPSVSTRGKMTIVNSYKELRNNKNSIGAIYLKKGRTQIIFVKERLEKNNLRLENGLKKHLIETSQLDTVSLISSLK